MKITTRSTAIFMIYSVTYLPYCLYQSTVHEDERRQWNNVEQNNIHYINVDVVIVWATKRLSVRHTTDDGSCTRIFPLVHAAVEKSWNVVDEASDEECEGVAPARFLIEETGCQEGSTDAGVAIDCDYYDHPYGHRLECLQQREDNRLYRYELLLTRKEVFEGVAKDGNYEVAAICKGKGLQEEQGVLTLSIFSKYDDRGDVAEYAEQNKNACQV